MSLRTALRFSFDLCIPSRAERPPSGPGWLHEIKHDGYRLIAHREADAVRLITRNGYDWRERYPTVTRAIERLPCETCVIDGEVVICGEDGRAIFERLQNGPRIKPDAVLYAFDLLELDGKDFRPFPLIQRKRALEKLIKKASPGVTYNDHEIGDGWLIFRHACKLGLEGIVSKRVTSPYRPGRSRDWIKTKSPEAIAAQRVRSENWNR
jgi:bifunctional non-homologous end joining protein LigD